MSTTKYKNDQERVNNRENLIIRTKLAILIYARRVEQKAVPDTLFALEKKEMRSETLNVSGIAGLGEACRLRQISMSKWLEAIKEVALPNPKLNFDTDEGVAMHDRLCRGSEDLTAVAEYLES